jgi:hypothetical protein
MSNKPFEIPRSVVEAAKLAGAAKAEAWLTSVTPEALDKLWLSDLASVLLGSGAPVDVLLASWPRSEHRDGVIRELLQELPQSASDLRVWWFEGPASWVDIRPSHPEPAEVARCTHLGALSFGHAAALAEDVGAMPFAFEPNPTSWSGTGKVDKYVPGKFVPGGCNLPPYYRLDDVLANGVAGVLVDDARRSELVAAAETRGCRATVLGPLQPTPAKVISWDGQGYGMNLTILQSAQTGYWVFCESVH